MMSSTDLVHTSTAPTSSLFQSAATDFLESLDDKESFDFSGFQTVGDVLEEIQKTQDEQGRKRGLRNMRKIQPFLDGIQQYAKVLDTFVQVKPDVLALIWGPVQFLIQVSRNSVMGFDKVLDMMRKISESLPEFQNFALIFEDNIAVTDILSLIYRDILDFYAIMIRFFQQKGWRTFFEALWPRYASKISVVGASMESHKLLMNSEVTVAIIRDARHAQLRALEEYDQSQKARERQDFEACKLALSPKLYDREMEHLQSECCDHTCSWLDSDAIYKRWYKSTNKSSTFLWLSGIPGAGKSHLSANLVWQMRQRKEGVLFAFLSHQQREDYSILDILQSLIFQLLYEYPKLRPVMQKAYDEDFRELQSSPEYNQQLFCNLMECAGPMFLIVDGLDEILEKERKATLNSFIEITKKCSSFKVMISSREESDISHILRSRAILLKIGSKNSRDISRYCDNQINAWLDDLDVDEGTSKELTALAKGVTRNAKGMFLYARLVIDNLKDQPDISAVRKEMANLPDGLDAAYGRMISRIQRLPPKQAAHAKNILNWIACSKVEMFKQEIIQALMVTEGDKTLVAERRLFQEITQLCGPIIEMHGDYVLFVHFTAKEYLLSPQSGPFIDLREGNRYLAHTCLTYLMFDCFDITTSTMEINDTILQGQYTLQVYATTNWLNHLKACSFTDGTSSDLEWILFKLRSFWEKRANPNFRLPDCESRTIPELKAFKHVSPNVYSWLCAVDSALSTESSSGVESQVSISKDPLTLLESWNTVHHNLCELLCSNEHRTSCKCNAIESHYGGRVHKCPRLLCAFSRIGFNSKTDRNRHASFHLRAHKCGFPDCEFAKIGFFTKAQLIQHTFLCHVQPTEPTDTPTADMNEDTVYQAIADAIEMGEVEYLKPLLDAIDDPPLNILLHIAYLRGANPQVLSLLESRGADIDDRITLHRGQLLADMNTHLRAAVLRLHQEKGIYQGGRSESRSVASDGPQNAVTKTIEGGSVEAIHWLVSRGVRIDEPLVDSNETITPLDYLLKRHRLERTQKTNKDPLPVQMITALLDHGVTVTNGPALQCLIECPFTAQEEAPYVEMARLMIQRGAVVKPDRLHYLVGTNFSCEMGRLLIENGADIEAPYIAHGNPEETPLLCSLRTNSQKAAEFARFLLESGAKTNLSEADFRARMNLKKFAKWAGMGWDDLVRSTQGA